MNHPGKCRNLHGHSVKAAITLAAENLNDQAMVCDFSDIKKYVENYVDQQLDHNFLLHREDPLVPILRQQNERFLELDEHPTAEVLSKMIYHYVKQGGFNVLQVELWETSSACARYSEA